MKGTIALMGVYFAVVIAGLYGYVCNLMKIVDMFGGEITGELVVRIVGCLAFPLGAVMGFF
jgi:hypothetical protein